MKVVRPTGPLKTCSWLDPVWRCELTGFTSVSVGKRPYNCGRVVEVTVGAGRHLPRDSTSFPCATLTEETGRL